jgi:hypothetical protein
VGDDEDAMLLLNLGLTVAVEFDFLRLQAELLCDNGNRQRLHGISDVNIHRHWRFHLQLACYAHLVVPPLPLPHNLTATSETKANSKQEQEMLLLLLLLLQNDDVNEFYDPLPVL